MFEINNNAGELMLTDNHIDVMGMNRIQVRMDSLGIVDLEFEKVEIVQKADQFGEYKQIQLVYKKGEKVDFSYILNCYEDFVHAFVNVDVHNERPQGFHDYLTSENCIVIHVGDLFKLNNLVAHYRHKDWWTRPYFDCDLTSLPHRTQSLFWESNHNFYYLLPAVDEVFKTELAGAEKGFNIVLSSYDGGRSHANTLSFVLAKGENPFNLSKKVTQRILKLTGTSKTIDEKHYPERLDYLGWCSWDAFYQDVNQEGILNKMEELKEKEIPVKWIMIDDGWSQVDDQRLSSFKPDKLKFPDGLKSLTFNLKKNFGIKSVGVWHTLAGYWGGIDPESKLATTMASYLFKTNSGKLVPYPNREKGFGFWDSWHSYLEQQGINFVKVDGQSGINNFLREQMPIGKSSRETHKALEASVGIHFDQCMINCMGMASENVYNRPISSVSRSSDDFVPDVKDYGFGEHALQNVYNNFYHGEVYYGDWDMFWSTHEDAERHALLRALSGGPIYTSDRVGQTNAELLRSLIYKDGKITRCDQPGKPTLDTLMVNPTINAVPMKVWNKNNGVGVLGVFHINLSKEIVSGSISPQDIEGIDAEEFIVYDFFNQTIEYVNRDSIKQISMKQDEFALYLFIPKQSITPIGMIEKYIASDGYKVVYSSKKKLGVQLREGGKFAFVSDKQPKQVLANGERMRFNSLKSDSNVYLVECSSEQKSILIEISI